MSFFIGILPPLSVTNEIDIFRKKWNYTGNSIPHIKVKAQSGLTDSERWIPKIKAICHTFPAFDLKLGPPAAFGSNILFTSVLSKEVITLHLLLVDAIKPTYDEQKSYFEVTDYIPHLTLAEKSDSLNESEFVEMKRDAFDSLMNFDPFTVQSIHLFSLNNSRSYTPVLELPLRPLRSVKVLS